MNTIAFTTDHPTWTTDPEQQPARIVLHQGEPWLITYDGVELRRHPLTDTTVEAPPIGCAFATDLPEHAEAAPLVAKLATLVGLPAATLATSGPPSDHWLPAVTGGDGEVSPA